MRTERVVGKVELLLEGGGVVGGWRSCWRVELLLEGGGVVGGWSCCWRVEGLLEGGGVVGGWRSCWRVEGLLEGGGVVVEKVELLFHFVPPSEGFTQEHNSIDFEFLASRLF